MKSKILFLMFVISFAVTAAYGQKSGKKITITGTVVDGTMTGVANAIVLVDGKKTDCFTDSKGYYKVKVSPDIKRIGIFTLTNGVLEETINGRKRINFQFEGTVPNQKKAESDPGEEPVNVGYGVTKKKNLTNAVGQIDGRELRFASYSSIYDMIRGEVPGVVVQGKNIYIRNPSSINSSNEPLFVVDGIPVSTIDDISPQNVRSIQVLKGSDASIYGVRGANGVILINMKKGSDR